jgi:hypothetical protein
MPDWLTSGSLPVILVIVVGMILIYAWVNWRLKIVQRNLHELGRSYYDKEKILIDDLKAGRITRGEYRRKHERLVSDMREESRKLTDGPPT